MVDVLTGSAFDAPRRMHHREDEVALEFPSSVSSRRRGLLALRAQNWRASGGGWTNPYITDGLVAMWDGEWNAGGGVHDGAATSWIDVVGGSAIDISDSVIGSLDVRIPSSRTADLQGSVQLSSCSLEIVMRIGSESGNQMFATLGQPNSWELPFGIAKGGYRLQARFSYKNANTYLQDNIPELAMNSLISLSQTYGGSEFSAYIKGSRAATKTISAQMSSVSGITIVRGGAYERAVCDYMSIRVYSRALTASEIAANYAVDAARFNLA